MRASGYDRNADDFYVEPAWVVDALLKRENFIGTNLDPSCGSGTIPKAFWRAALPCSGSDIADRGFGLPEVDFLKTEPSLVKFNNIISNPPYGILQEWIDHALKCADSKVAVIARLAFLESEKRRSWFHSVPLARVWVSSKRVSMPPGGSDVPARGGSIAYAWYVFDHSRRSAPSLGWL